MKQDQFLTVVDRDTAAARFAAALAAQPLERETVPLGQALGRVLADDVRAEVDVPAFDRSNYDGFAIQAKDATGAREEDPRVLHLLDEAVAAGVRPAGAVGPGEAMAIATGGMVPRGADAIMMIEHVDLRDGQVVVRKSVAPGFGIAYAGSDVAVGEIVLLASTLLTSRETGVLAAIGLAEATVWRQPVVAILSTGDELIAPGEPMQPPLVYDSNAQILADAVRELGGLPRIGGIVPDDLNALRRRLHAALAEADAVLLSGGTSKGQGDLCYRVVAELEDPGIVAHGVALKPGKPICLAASGGKPVVILPGFPTSAVFTFHEFVAPVIRQLGGRSRQHLVAQPAKMAVRVNSEIGRTEYLLVGLVDGPSGATAYPMGKGSGSVTTFSKADGFVTIDRHTEIVDAGAEVDVQRLGRATRPADLVVVGSHCIGLDWLLSELSRRGVAAKFIAVGSTAGLEAARRGECDLAGVHLLHPEANQYNAPFLTDGIELIPGYRRRQGLVFRRDDPRFEGDDVARLIADAATDLQRLMVNRNAGSGTRVLLDQLLAGAEPPGYSYQARSHNAVAAAVAQGRADWGLAIEAVAAASDLAFVPCRDEQFDFVVPTERRSRPGVRAFAQLLAEEATQQRLSELGCVVIATATSDARR